MGLSNVGNNSSIHDQRTLACPTGSYAYAVMGQSGKSVDQITGIKCKNVFDGSMSTNTTNRVGGTGGSAPKTPIACDPNQPLHGFKFWAQTNLDGLTGVCLNGDSGVMGNNGAKGPGQQIENNDNWVSSITGATSNNNVIANFGYDTRNFTQMKSLASDTGAGMDCCTGKNSTSECADAKNASGGLNCAKTAQQYCSEGSNMFDDTRCKDALNQGVINLDWAKQAQLNWCKQSANFNDSRCMQLCTADSGEETASGLSPSIKTQCNTIYEDACSKPENKGLDICQCLWNWTDYPQDLQDSVSNIKPVPGVPEPRCYWPTCVKSGYKKDVLKAGVCPACISQQTVSIANNTGAVGAITSTCNVGNSSSTASAAAPIVQGAGDKGVINPSTAPPPAPGEENKTTTLAAVTPAGSSSSKLLLYGGVGAGVFFALLLLILVAKK